LEATKGELGLGPARDVVSRKLGDRMVLVNLRTNHIFELNRTASRMWELLGEGADRAGLEEALLSEFEVEQPRLSQEIDQTLANLSSEGLIVDHERA